MLRFMGTRKLDELGRFVVPIHLRRSMDITPEDGVEIYLEGDRIVIKKYYPSCVFCGNTAGVFTYKNKDICPSCSAELNPVEYKKNRS